jgi:hypothetical protein
MVKQRERMVNEISRCVKLLPWPWFLHNHSLMFKTLPLHLENQLFYILFVMPGGGIIKPWKKVPSSIFCNTPRLDKDQWLRTIYLQINKHIICIFICVPFVLTNNNLRMLTFNNKRLLDGYFTRFGPLTNDLVDAFTFLFSQN